ncbi:hypothetical protein [Nitrososphaera sp.]|uniref:beta strand repeat-containing protein n=1 Tax=Nitrososphaera sp. TaxID=1971748 RepID=UPI00307EBA98
MLISVSSHASDTGQGTLPVTITAFGASSTYQVSETGTTSGLFLMYIKADPTAATPDEPLVPNTPFSSSVLTRLYIGPAGVAGTYPATSGTAPHDNENAELAATVVEGGSVQISANGVTKTITWDDSPATLTLDRAAYGPAGTIIAQIKDQDANLDPTRANTITETAAAGDELITGTDAPATTATTVWTETGPNTAAFELTSITASGLGQSVDSIARSLSANDYKAFTSGAGGTPITPNAASASYGAIVTTGVQGTASTSYTVQAVRGQFQTVNATTYASELPLRINDLDRNTQSRSEQAIGGAIRVSVANVAAGSLGSSTNPLLFNIRELSLNSNTFRPNYSGDDIDVTPGTPASIGAPDTVQGILKVQPGNDIVVEYLDAFFLPAGPAFNENSMTARIDLNGNGSFEAAASLASVNEAGIRLDLNADGDTGDTVNGIVESQTRVDLNGDLDFSDTLALTGSFNEQTTVVTIDLNDNDLTAAVAITPPGPIIEATASLDIGNDGTILAAANANGITESRTAVDFNAIDLGGVSSRITFQIGNTAPTLAADKTTVSRGGSILYTLTDPDLNDDTGVIESYTINFVPQNNAFTDTDFATTNGVASGTTPATRVIVNSAAVMDGRIRISGSARDLASTFSLTFTETGANTGIFTANLNLQTLSNALGSTFSFVDGDNVELTIKDVMDQTQSVFTEVSRTTQIGLAKPVVTVDRSTVPVPRVGTGNDATDETLAIPKSAANLGPAIIHITITDPAANTNSQTQETLFGTQTTTTTAGVLTLGGKLRLTFQNSAGTTFTGATGVTISKAIKETGFDTGVFEGQIQIDSNPADTPAQWIGSKMKIEYAGQDNTFGNTDDADTTSVGFTARNAVMTTDTTIVANGKAITILVNDADANRDVTTAERVRVSIKWVDDTGATRFQLQTLDETGINTGQFRKKLDVGTSVVGGVTFRVNPDQDVRFRYYDLAPNLSGASTWAAASSTTTQIDLTFRTSADLGGLTISSPGNVVGPATQIKVSIVDNDLNTNPSSKQTVTGRVTATSDRGAGSRADLNIDETGPNTAVFEGKVRLNPAQAAGAANTPSNDVTINALPGDLVAIRYEDEKGANGQRTTVTKTVQVVSRDPVMNFSKTGYAIGDTIELTLNDLDANRDPDTADILTLRVTSTTDAVGLTNVQAIETGPNTGVFKAVIQTSRTFSTGALQVSNGDNVTVEYEDAFPAAFRQKFDNNGTLAGSTQKFRVNTVIGTVPTTDSTTPSKPSLVNVDGSSVREVTAGQQVVITTTIKNNDDQPRPATVIVEVRDADDITVYLQWQTATIAASGDVNVGLSWIPDGAGTYTIRTFVVDDLSTPAILSDIVESEITVS